tara:strand:- start:5323 stop:7023 length:1701 start_codon:yes stop_codon:yes gene_type:complete
LEIVGKKIGRYEVLEHIGEGAMAQVFKAFDPEINRSVALKVLKAEHCEKDEHKSRFLKEGKAAGVLTHPNIVTIYDVGSIDDSPYIMMELLLGETLGDIMQQGQRLPLKSILESASKLADALDYAHSKGVVHRDMKPDNIMLDPQGETVKIADFGIARVEEASSKESTQVGMMLGTPRYMSPEQATGATIDGRSDLFALGVIMYEMITGQKAFDAESMPTLIMQIVQKDPVPIRQITTDAPVGVQKIVNKLLQKNPDKRFQTGRELKEALQRELLVLQESEEDKRRYLPLQIKWTAIMAAVVACAMALSTYLVYNVQRDALTKQAIDSGLSLTKFIAVQAAIPVLGEDWITLESLVQDASARDTFSYLIVSDHEDVVRSASNMDLVGQPWEMASTTETLYQRGSTTVTDLGDTFNFNVPVLFNQTEVGSVNVGLDTRALDAALSTTARLMVILAFAMVLAVSLVIYIFNKAIAKNLLVATQALRLFGDNHREVRISKSRDDEFGDLFDAYNGMADSVERTVDASLVGNPTMPTDNAEPVATDVSGITNGMLSDPTVMRDKNERSKN